MKFPRELRYTKEHEWVKVDGNKAFIGITHFAQSELGDIVFVDLPEVGTQLKINEPFGSVESVKTVSELYAPISGQVVEINEMLEDNPEYVNESPYEKAWMIILAPANVNEVDDLMTAEQYEKTIKSLE